MDYIEREAARVALRDNVDWVFGVIRLSAMNELNNVPAADVAPVRHGKWLFLNDYEGKCDQCNTEQYIDHSKEPNYCGECGARMDL